MSSLKEAVLTAICDAERRVAWPDLGTQYPLSREHHIEGSVDKYIAELEEYMKHADDGTPLHRMGLGEFSYDAGYWDAFDKMLKFLKGEEMKKGMSGEQRHDGCKKGWSREMSECPVCLRLLCDCGGCHWSDCGQRVPINEMCS
jgi:hypothetical protein